MVVGRVVLGVVVMVVVVMVVVAKVGGGRGRGGDYLRQLAQAPADTLLGMYKRGRRWRCRLEGGRSRYYSLLRCAVFCILRSLWRKSPVCFAEGLRFDLVPRERGGG